MNDLIAESFRHSAWATRTLIDACRPLSNEQRAQPGLGFGSIIRTLNHIVLSDRVYLNLLAPDLLSPRLKPGSDDTTDTEDLDELTARATSAAEGWARLFAEPFNAHRVLSLDGGTYECPASVVITQALQHATGHREQVRLNLRPLGIAPPNLQPWEFALDTSLARTLPANTERHA